MPAWRGPLAALYHRLGRIAERIEFVGRIGFGDCALLPRPFRARRLLPVTAKDTKVYILRKLLSQKQLPAV
jgi:hypothetical protein